MRMSSKTWKLAMFLFCCIPSQTPNWSQKSKTEPVLGYWGFKFSSFSSLRLSRQSNLLGVHTLLLEKIYSHWVFTPSQYNFHYYVI